jgi:uncharacterized protein
VDGPASYHDKYRRGPGGELSHEAVQRGLRLLLKHGVEFNSLVVLSRANVHDPDGVYRYLTNAGLRHVQLIPLLEYDPATFVPIPQAITGRQYGEFLCRIFDLWFEHNIGSIFVQIIEQTLAAHLGISPSLCIHMPTCGRALILEHNGDVYACDHYPFPTHLRGNIHDKPLHEMVNSPEQLEFGRSKKADLTTVCRQCPYLPACNGGCCKHRIVAVKEEGTDETGSPDSSYAVAGQAGNHVSGGMPAIGGGVARGRPTGGTPSHNWFCEGYRMFFEHSYDRLEVIATALRRGLPPRTARDECMRQKSSDSILLDASGRPMQRAREGGPDPILAVPSKSRPAGKPDRNTPCPCGSGLKFKKCCGRKA